MPISDSLNWELVCRFRTPIELLGNTSEVEVPLQKIGDQIEVFPYKKKHKNKTEIQLTVKKINCTCDTISKATDTSGQLLDGTFWLVHAGIVFTPW